MSVFKSFNENGKIQVGDRCSGIIKNIKPYGAFVELENGINGMIHIEDFSVARISSPSERVKIGQNVNLVVKSVDNERNRINFSYKENFGTWEENARKFSVGMNTQGIVRETEKNKNGIFIEITPNLVGMIEYQDGLEFGDKIDVAIKKIDYEKRKVKLTINNKEEEKW